MTVHSSKRLLFNVVISVAIKTVRLFVKGHIGTNWAINRAEMLPYRVYLSGERDVVFESLGDLPR